MTLPDAVSEALGRTLEPGEVDLIECLSAQGVAKVNADLSRGIDLEQTLTELKIVFKGVTFCRTKLGSSLPVALQSLLGKMQRYPTVSEMVLFTDVHCDVLLERINSRLATGVDLGDVVEELAEAHGLLLMQLDAQRLAIAEGKSVRLCTLPPTELCGSDLAGSMISVKRCIGTVRMGPGPLVSWFSEQVPESPDKCPSVSCPSLGSDSRRSALKRDPPLPPAPSSCCYPETRHVSFSAISGSSRFSHEFQAPPVYRASPPLYACEVAPPQELRRSFATRSEIEDSSAWLAPTSRTVPKSLVESPVSSGPAEQPRPRSSPYHPSISPVTSSSHRSSVSGDSASSQSPPHKLSRLRRLRLLLTSCRRGPHRDYA